MRDKDTSTASFRKLLREISLLLAYEVTRELPMTTKRIETPLGRDGCAHHRGQEAGAGQILRAGNGLLDGILELIPAARVGFVGLYRDPETLQPVQYYCKLPDHMEDRIAIVVDPMLATGNSSAAAVSLLKTGGGAADPLPVPLGRPRGHRPDEGGASRCADRHGGGGQPSERPRLYRAGPRGCRGPDVRHQMSGRGWRG
jgi:uracil phosphoribosyltransferase